MGICRQDVSDPGAKRNKEVRKCFKFSFNLGCSENWVGNKVWGGGAVTAPVYRAERKWLRAQAPGPGRGSGISCHGILAEAGQSLTSLHRPTRSSLSLATRVDQRSKTRAVADERNIQWEDGAGEALSPRFPELSCHHPEPQSSPHHHGPLLPKYESSEQVLPQPPPGNGLCALSSPAELHDGDTDPQPSFGLPG